MCKSNDIKVFNEDSDTEYESNAEDYEKESKGQSRGNICEEKISGNSIEKHNLVENADDEAPSRQRSKDQDSLSSQSSLNEIKQNHRKKNLKKSVQYSDSSSDAVLRRSKRGKSSKQDDLSDMGHSCITTQKGRKFKQTTEESTKSIKTETEKVRSDKKRKKNLPELMSTESEESSIGTSLRTRKIFKRKGSNTAKSRGNEFVKEKEAE